MIWVGIALMVVALFLIPIGLPGTWIMVAVLAVAAIYRVVGLTTLAIVVVVATLAELLEFLVVKRLTARYGGSRAAFWGAIVGGILGVIVGAPVPVIGSIIAAFLGSFAGAALVTLLETRKFGAAGRVGWGVVLGRALAAGVKVFAGVVILVLGGFALLA
ncbi:MAG: DUF456 domain-containing protein [Longimicrobiales bacterium]